MAQPQHAIQPEIRKTQRKVLAAVRRSVRARQLWQPGDRVLLACSGGADSLVALDLLDRLQPSLGHRIVVGHVDHGLWDGSAGAGQLVAQACQLRGLTFAVRRLDLPPGADLEARAREGRYAALHAIAAEHDCARIATAHHADDQAETLLLRAARGAGLEALSGIRWQRDDGVVRPLLDVPRAWLRILLGDATIAPDPSNADVHFSRNALRLQVLPVLEQALPGASAGLARTAGHLTEHGASLQAWLELALEPRTILHPKQTVPADPNEPRHLQIETTGLPGLRSTRLDLLRYAARRLGQAVPGVRAGEQFCALLASPTARTCAVKGLRVEKRCTSLHFYTTETAADTPLILPDVANADCQD